MARVPSSKRDIDILEERGLWKASSSLHQIIKRLIRKNLPVEMRYIKEAHRIIFTTANQAGMAGKYRRDNPELKRIDGSLLKMEHWSNIANAMAELDMDLRENSKHLKRPETIKEYSEIIQLAVRLSHRLACIHPFENGNGRASRLLLNAILLRAGLPEIAIRKKKSQYLRAMRQADDGDFSLFEKIVIDGIIESKERQYKMSLRKSTK